MTCNRKGILLFFLACGFFGASSGAGASHHDSKARRTAATKAGLEEKYALRHPIDWRQRLGEDVSPAVMGLLESGRYQEAIWLLQDAKAPRAAAVVKAFLRQAMEAGELGGDRVVPLGMGGATKPLLVYLPWGVKGVFKKKSSHPSSDYRAEIVAYLMDQLLDFRLVPMTIERQVKKHTGSLQYFVAGAELAHEHAGYRKSANLNVFDYLISNKDRNCGNILIVLGREVAIDHGLALRGANLFGRGLSTIDHIFSAFGYIKDPIRQKHIHPRTHIAEYLADRRILRKLASLTYLELQTFLGAYVRDDTTERIYRKKEALVKNLRAVNYL